MPFRVHDTAISPPSNQHRLIPKANAVHAAEHIYPLRQIHGLRISKHDEALELMIALAVIWRRRVLRELPWRPVAERPTIRQLVPPLIQHHLILKANAVHAAKHIDSLRQIHGLRISKHDGASELMIALAIIWRRRVLRELPSRPVAERESQMFC
ncbi:hypothetical protein CEXT_620461 [Caerostris extrusa]|uniref:Uncharacterized protein n=1 Tax=Caerostris extrusa TaxID=172846 RepID=A0AAV4VHB5_CAEEX|nr:hypothetical protein CEXT_620461 [Caerostris extrusa]